MLALTGRFHLTRDDRTEHRRSVMAEGEPEAAEAKPSPADLREIRNDARVTGVSEVDDALGEVDEKEQRVRAEGETRQNRNLPPQSPYGEVKTLLWIKHNPVYSATLDEWERKERYFTSRVDRREKRSADLTNQIYNIVGFFSVFQGVVLTAVSQLASGTQPTCGKIYVPGVLSLFATIVAFIGIWEKFTSLKEVEKTMHADRREQKVAAGRSQKLRAAGKRFSFHLDTNEVEKKDSKGPKSFIKDQVLVSCALVIFTLFIIWSFVVILCNKGVVKKWEKGLVVKLTP